MEIKPTKKPLLKKKGLFIFLSWICHVELWPGWQGQKARGVWPPLNHGGRVKSGQEWWGRVAPTGHTTALTGWVFVDLGYAALRCWAERSDSKVNTGAALQKYSLIEKSKTVFICVTSSITQADLVESAWPHMMTGHLLEMTPSVQNKTESSCRGSKSFCVSLFL